MQTGTRPPAAGPRSYTPKHLADKILQSRSALEGERKQVTVLFADVKGSMELAEQLDPEEWHRILDKFFAILTDGVHRFEGTVNQYTGDGIMALFGAPIAHEDHAQRACYAALHLCEELKRYADDLRRTAGVSLSTRIGINSGEVVVGRIGDDLRMDYTAQGHTVGLAQRMEARAAADSAYLTAHTARLVEGYFRLRDLGEFDLKGVSNPLRVYELLGVGPHRTRLDASRSRGFSRFVGREAEMRLLETALDRSLGGEAQIVGVVGEAGVGKSRLCNEFLDGCRARRIAVYEAHCLSHGEAMPFLPILQLFRGYFGIRESDPPAEARQRIAGALLLLDERFREVLPLLFDFLGIPDPERPLPQMRPEVRQRHLLAFTSELLRARSAREPAVLLLDDLHWIDSGSEAMLGQLVPSSGSTRTLFLLNFRPEYHADWMGRPDYQQVAMRPLGPEATAELLREQLGGDPSVAPLIPRLQERVGGNPFFAEELVRALADAGALAGSAGNYVLGADPSRVSIPSTVQSLLAARIDRLPQNDKAVLSAAAVIGKEFGEPLLRAVVAGSGHGPTTAEDLSAALARLTRADLIVERALYPEAEYAFRHPLVQEVSYHSQLSDQRARLHGHVARALERQHAASLDERAPLLAHHCEAAGETSAALQWHARAGAWFAARDLSQSLAHYQRVRALLPQVAESPQLLTLGARACAWILHAAWRVRLPADEYAAILTQGYDWAERSGDPGVLARVLDAQVTLLTLSTGDRTESEALLSRAQALAERTTDRSLQVGLQQRMAWLLGRTASTSEAMASLDRGIALAAGDVTLGIDVIGWSSLIFMVQQRAFLLASMGRLDEALQAVEQGERLTNDHDDVQALWMLWTQKSVLAGIRGEVRAALSAAMRVVEVAERMDVPLYRMGAYSSLAQALVLCERWEDALGASERAWAILRDEFAGTWAEMAMSLHDVTARAKLGAGMLEEARAAALATLDLCERAPELGFPSANAYLGAAHVLLRTEGPSSPNTVKALERTDRMIESLHLWGLRPRLHLEYAERARLLGNDAALQEHRREAHRLFAEMGATAHAARLAKEMGL